MKRKAIHLINGEYRYLYALTTTIVLIVGGFTSYSQTRDEIRGKVDSLKNALALVPTCEERHDILYELIILHVDNDNCEAAGFAADAYNLSCEIGDSLKIAKSGRMLGQMLRRVNDSKKALDQLNRALGVARRNSFVEEELRILNALSVLYLNSADFDKALTCNFGALEIGERRGDSRGIIISLINVGLCYYKLGDFETSLQFSQRGLQEIIVSGIDESIDKCYMNLGLCYNELHDYEKALEFINKGFAACRPDCTDQIKVEGEFGLGAVFLSSKRLQEAQLHFEESYRIAIAMEDRRFQAEDLLALGKIHYERKEYEKAEHSFTSAERLASGEKFEEILFRIYRELSSLYMLKRNFIEVALYQSKYAVLRDSVYNRKVVRNLKQAEIDYRQYQDRTKIADQEQILTLKEEAIYKRDLLIISLVVVGILLCAVVFLLYRLSAYRKQISRELDQRIRERTIDLLGVEGDARRIVEERLTFLETISNRIKALTATVKGLSLIASKEGDQPMLNYNEKLGPVSDQLEELGKLVQRGKENGRSKV